jgi:hypothetical protein
MPGLGKWTRTSGKFRSLRLKAQRESSKGKSLLSTKEPTSGSGESAAVHFVQSDLLSFGDESKESDNDLAVVKTIEKLTVIGSDIPISVQEKEARTTGGIPFQ